LRQSIAKEVETNSSFTSNRATRNEMQQLTAQFEAALVYATRLHAHQTAK